MEFSKVAEEAIRIKKLLTEYEEKKFGRKYTSVEVYLSLISDVGDLSRLILAKNGVRNVPNLTKKIDHEFSDLLWAVLVLANEYEVDIEEAFFRNMRKLEEEIKNDLES